MTRIITAYKIVLAQLVLALVAGIVAWGAKGSAMAVAVFAGGLINVIANLYFALHVFRGGVRPAPSVLRGFYLAEVVKLLLTAALFALALGVLKLAPLPLLLGFSVTLAGYWLALLPAGPAQRWIKA
ncbi:MAG: ATP synthase subunit I [Gammaproteobacteria bacterium]|nr:ATP synthase subunit I [Gammaproteobacteria bacterium]MDH3370725.1 ATP synthase subunit I [Gammaproteobacteria bacterium]MDH3406387.1 ATP synthase subunit I [Gammaproteobacteria bacterium]MDH3562290.1 ATP synthase subunit I [Gammaproteobacteria bacterium]MDH5486626.1 ATP synthase subunit I [Gammaproteobacteria bacterium]